MKLDSLADFDDSYIFQPDRNACEDRHNFTPEFIRLSCRPFVTLCCEKSLTPTELLLTTPESVFLETISCLSPITAAVDDLIDVFSTLTEATTDFSDFALFACGKELYDA